LQDGGDRRWVGGKAGQRRRLVEGEAGEVGQEEEERRCQSSGQQAGTNGERRTGQRARRQRPVALLAYGMTGCALGHSYSIIESAFCPCSSKHILIYCHIFCFLNFDVSVIENEKKKN
jgi:hypothetical protein